MRPFSAVAALLLAVAFCAHAVPPVTPTASRSRVAAADAADIAIGKRLGARYAAVSGLHAVDATVVRGVAILDGEVVTDDQRKLAEVIASQTPGVSRVENHIELSSRLADRFQAAFQAASDKLVRLIGAAPLLLVAVAIVLLSIRLGHVVSRLPFWTRRLHSSNPYMEGLVQRILRWLVVLAGVVLALDLIGATALAGALLGSAGVVGLVLGFAFKDIVENYVAGVLLSLRRPFVPGDHLLIDLKHEGRVVALTARSTLLLTLDGNQLTLPNALVFRSVVLNYTQSPKRRFDFLMPLDPGAPVDATQREGLAAVAGVEGVLADPPPYALVQEYLPDRLSVQFLGWVDQTRNSLDRVRSEAMRAAKGAIDRAGIRRAGTPARGDATLPSPPVAQERHGSGDTSVNRDIDQQLAQAQRENDADNLLDPGKVPQTAGASAAPD